MTPSCDVSVPDTAFDSLVSVPLLPTLYHPKGTRAGNHIRSPSPTLCHPKGSRAGNHIRSLSPSPQRPESALHGARGGVLHHGHGCPGPLPLGPLERPLQQAIGGFCGVRRHRGHRHSGRPAQVSAERACPPLPCRLTRAFLRVKLVGPPVLSAHLSCPFSSPLPLSISRPRLPLLLHIQGIIGPSWTSPTLHAGAATSTATSSPRTSSWAPRVTRISAGGSSSSTSAWP